MRKACEKHAKSMDFQPSNSFSAASRTLGCLKWSLVCHLLREMLAASLERNAPRVADPSRVDEIEERKQFHEISMKSFLFAYNI